MEDPEQLLDVPGVESNTRDDKELNTEVVQVGCRTHQVLHQVRYQVRYQVLHQLLYQVLA